MSTKTLGGDMKRQCKIEVRLPVNIFKEDGEFIASCPDKKDTCGHVLKDTMSNMGMSVNDFWKEYHNF